MSIKRFGWNSFWKLLGRTARQRKRAQGLRFSPAFEVLEERQLLNGQSPITLAESYGLPHDRIYEAVASVLATDTATDGAALTAALVQGPAHGTLTLQANGHFTYQPDPHFVGTDTFLYQAGDGTNVSDPVQVSLLVANEAPAAEDDALGMPALDTVTYSISTLLENDRDAEGDALSVQLVQEPAYGDLVWNDDGTLSYDPSTDFPGVDSFTYQLHDGLTESNEAVVTIQATAAGEILIPGPNPGDGAVDNEPFSPPDDCHPGPCEGGNTAPILNVYFPLPPKLSTAIIYYGSWNVQDPDGPENPTRVSGDPTKGVFDWIVNGTDPMLGSLSYRAYPGSTGADSIPIQVTDGLALSNLVTINVTINAPPAAVQYGPFSLVHDSPAQTWKVMASSQDPDQDPLQLVIDVPPAHGSLTVVKDAQSQDTGDVTYTPTPEFVGSDSFTYRVWDGYDYSPSRTVQITITNQSPIAQPDGAFELPKKVGGNGWVLTNDWDPDPIDVTRKLTPWVTQGPANGTLTWHVGGDSLYTGTFTYVPASPTWTGTDSFKYKADDRTYTEPPSDQNLSNETTVSINVVDLPPVANPDTDYSVVHNREGFPVDHTLVVDAPGVLSNDDSPDEDPLTAILVSNITPQDAGQLTLSGDGSFTFVPFGGFVGTASFTYKAKDANGPQESAATTVSIQVTDTKPSVPDRDYPGLGHNAPLTRNAFLPDAENPSAQATDPEEDFFIATNATASIGSVSMQSDGTFTYTPPSGVPWATVIITYQAIETGAGHLSSDPGSITLHLGNNAPVVPQERSYSIAHDTTLEDMNLFLVDAENPAAFAYDPEGDPLEVLPPLSFQTSQGGSVQIGESGDFSYTPPAGYVGEDSFTYQATDNFPESPNGPNTISNTGTVTITVTNALPQANDDGVFDVSYKKPSSHYVLVNDTQEDDDPYWPNTTPDGSPSHGSLEWQATGDKSTTTVKYIPAGDYLGSDVGYYWITDLVGLSNVAMITFNVVNFAPSVSQPDDKSSVEGETVNWQPVTATDPDDDTLAYTAANLPPGLGFNASTGLVTGTIDFSATETNNGEYPVSITVTDGVNPVTRSFLWTVTASAWQPDGFPTPLLSGVCGCDDGYSDYPVRYFDGVARLERQDLDSVGSGNAWGLGASWTNGKGYVTSAANGSGTVQSQFPTLIQDASGDHVALIVSGSDARFFDKSGSTFVPRFFFQDTLTHSPGTQEFILTDPSGNVLHFFDFSTGLPAGQRGQLKSLTDPAGNIIAVTSRTADGKPSEVQRTTGSGGSANTESYLSFYISSGANSGRLGSVIQRRQQGTQGWATLRQVDYTYYDGVEAHGSTGDLKLAIVRDGAGSVLDTTYYRYYTGEAGGYVHGLKHVFNAASFDRLATAFVNPYTATDAEAAPFADNYFEYDAQQRITKEIAAGAGASIGDGRGTLNYEYSLPSTHANDYNSWKHKTTETLQD